MVNSRARIAMTEQEITAFVAAGRTAILVTIGPDGVPDPVAMWYLVNDAGEVLMRTYARSQKVANLRRDPRMSLLIESGEHYRDLRGVAISGTVELDPDTDLVADTVVGLMVKYEGVGAADAQAARPAAVERAVKQVALRVRPSSVLSWDHRKQFQDDAPAAVSPAASAGSGVPETPPPPQPGDRSPLVQRLARARLYLCTDARRSLAELEEFAEAVLSGGVDIIQLRHKGIEAQHELSALAVLAAACRRHGALLAANDRADIAAAAQTEILHLGQDDLPVTVARRIIGPTPIVGRSSHTLTEATAAASQAGVDYFAVGPCWPTPTKPGRPAPGLALVRQVASLAPPRPWFAIGGIEATNLAEVLAAGARRVVVVRALTQARDPQAMARELAERLAAAAS